MSSNTYLSLARQKKLKEYYKQQFIEKNSTDPRYIEKPDLFLKYYFRPSLEYIRAVTGLDVSNSTVKNILSEIDSPESMAVEETAVSEEEKPKKEKVVKIKDLKKAANGLLGLMDLFQTEDVALLAMFEETKTVLEELKSELEAYE